MYLHCLNLECKCVFIIRPILAIGKCKINTFVGVHASCSAVNVTVSNEINNILVVISFFILSQSSRNSSILPVPKLHSYH